jgi:hypothetical protein
MAVAARSVVLAGFVLALLVPLAVAYDLAIVSGAVGAGERGPRAAVASLVLGAIVLAGLVPRADAPHVQAAVPVAVLAVFSSALAGPAPPASLVALAGIIAVPATLVALVLSIDTVHRIPFAPDQVDREVPHFRRLPVARRVPGRSPSDGHELRAQTDGRVFLLRPDAAFWYLAGDLRNPTPFDYPYASVFGPRGQTDVVRDIERGAIRWVCLAEPMVGRLAPDELQSFVSSSMDAVTDTAAGTLYASRAES